MTLSAASRRFFEHRKSRIFVLPAPLSPNLRQFHSVGENRRILRAVPCTSRYHAAGDGSGGSQWGKLDFQAIVEADEPVPAHRSVAERSLLLGSTDPRPARRPDVVAGATSSLLPPFFVAPVHQQTSTLVRSFICYQPECEGPLAGQRVPGGGCNPPQQRPGGPSHPERQETWLASATPMTHRY